MVLPALAQPGHLGRMLNACSAFAAKNFFAELSSSALNGCRGDTERKTMRICLTILTAGLLAAAAIPGRATADGLPGYQDEGPVYRGETYRPPARVYERETHTYEREYRRAEPPRVVVAPAPTVVVTPPPVAAPIIVERRVVVSPPVVVTRPVVVAPRIVAAPPAYAEECATVSGVRPGPWGPRAFTRTRCF
jgi:hypothetical protein